MHYLLPIQQYFLLKKKKKQAVLNPFDIYIQLTAKLKLIVHIYQV